MRVGVDSSPALFPRCPGYELLRYASSIHMLSRLPDALLVDDLHALCDLPAGDRPRPRDMALCRVLASLHEAAVRAGCTVRACLGRLLACTSPRCPAVPTSLCLPCLHSAASTAVPCIFQPLGPHLSCRQEVVAALKQAPCQLVATQLSPAEAPRQLYMLQRWLPLVLHIRRECST